jgi:hypothetical protein
MRWLRFYVLEKALVKRLYKQAVARIQVAG